MDSKDFGWQREKPQVSKRDYWFDGAFQVTEKVKKNVPELERVLIYADVKNLVGYHGGQDAVQVYTNKNKDYTLLLVDNATRASLQSGASSPEDNYCTLMFDHER